MPTGIVTTELVRADRQGQTVTGGAGPATCGACGATGHAGDARFCRRCGAPLDAEG